jgi:2,5-diamino-6-(ribosylamino)-4(3H)-pyrimidinone 5'-phosphate reductase
VDLRSALKILNERYNFETFRIDAGGTLNSHMLNEGLVDEISILLTPEIVGRDHEQMFADLNRNIKLELKNAEMIGSGMVHLIYEVK